MNISDLRFAVLTISDRVAEGSRDDRGGDALAAEITQTGATVTVRGVVADDRGAIETALRQFCTQADVVLTTGGTGMGPRDVTPEATRAVVDREAPGIPETLRQASLAITPYAMLSRAAAGLVGTVLVVNLPGSPKAVVEEWAVLQPVLAHAVETARGPVPDASHHHPGEKTAG